MKSLLTLAFIIIVFTANATTYYFSVSGNDADNGTSTSTPWKTLSKFNSVFASKSPGDNFLFKRGDVFYGKMTISRSGSSTSPITIGAYGTGAMPVITGLTTVSAWTNLGSNIWESTNAVSSVKYTNLVLVNGVNTPMGRYPNTGYLSYQTHGTHSITSSSLSGTPNWKGAEAGISNTPYTIIRCPITAQSGGTLTYTNDRTNPDSLFNTINSFFLGNFIIQNDPRTLDVKNEWYYNPSTKKIRIYNTVSPTNVQVSTIDTLVYMNGRSYITFDGISFQGANSSAIEGNNSPHIVVKNCDFNFSGRNAIHGLLNYVKVESCTMNHTNSNAIDLVNSTYATVRLCTITNTGMIVMGMQAGSSRANAISTRGDNELIEYNNIDSTGFCGIRFLGSNIIIQNNFVNHSCLILYNGGSIYTFNSGSLTRSGTKILNNIVLSTAIKNGAIYLDDHSNGILIKGNTAAFTAQGIYLHSAWNIQVLNNTTYSNDNGIMPNWNDKSVTANSLTIKNNIFFAKTATQKTGNYYTEFVATMPLPFTADSNYYARPIDDNLTIQTVLWPTTVVQRTLAGWATLNTQEAHSHKSPKTITDVNDLRFEYNATSSNKTISLDANYIDVKNVSYNGSITLAPYTSAVLIKNGATTANQSPTANAGSDQTITLPTGTVSLSGSGTDPDGTIASYNWTKISGPSAGTITSATSAATTVTALVQGVYQFQLKVTDNKGATGLSTVQITVNAAGSTSPTANAGADQSITLPTSTVSLSGSGTDPDGTIASYNWTKISGPSAGTITSATSAATTVTALEQGVYKFQLKVIDNSSATDLDTVQVTVNDVTTLLPAVNPANTVNGLDYKYYEASKYSVVPDFSILTPVKTGTSTNFDISLANRPEVFSFNFTGFINVPSDGVYTFYTFSDDGSNLYIDNVLVVNNDKIHYNAEKSGTIGLKAGKHAISVGYFNQLGGKLLIVSYEGPGISRKAVPASALYRISSSGQVARDNNMNQTITSSTAVGIKTYPNPFANYIEISVTGGVAGEYKLMLVDASGKVVWTKSGIKDAGDFQQSINTSTLQRGIYFLKVIQNTTNTVIKLVK